jgi:hypothetical protein
MKMLYIQKYTHTYSTTYSCRRRSTARPQHTTLLLRFARSVSLLRLAAPTRANSQRDKHNSPAASQKRQAQTPWPWPQQQQASKGQFTSSSSPFDRLVFRSSAFLSITTTNISVTTTSYLLLAIAPSSLVAISFLTIVLSAITRARPQPIHQISTPPPTHAARALIRPRAPPPHRTLRHRARSPCPRPPQTLPRSSTSARL